MLNFEEREELRGEGREKKWGRMRKVAFGSVLNPNRVTSDGLGVQSNKGYVEVEVTRKSGGKKTKEKMKRTPPVRKVEVPFFCCTKRLARSMMAKKNSCRVSYHQLLGSMKASRSNWRSHFSCTKRLPGSMAKKNSCRVSYHQLLGSMKASRNNWRSHFSCTKRLPGSMTPEKISCWVSYHQLLGSMKASKSDWRSHFSCTKRLPGSMTPEKISCRVS